VKNAPVRLAFALVWMPLLPLSAEALESSGPTLEQTVDGIVSRLYATLDEKALVSLNDETVLKLITREERDILARKYWYFDVDAPAVVSVVRSVGQATSPYWIREAGFNKTTLVVRNEAGSYEVWQKRFDAGRVELGINGFDMNRTVYFVCVGPQTAGATVRISNLFPSKEAVVTMKKGAWTYRDWDDLFIEQLPASLEGQILLTTFRGRAREAHLVGAFRKTPCPSSTRPDQVVLTWSEDPRTTQTIQWRTSLAVKDGRVRYRVQGTDPAAAVEVRAQCKAIEDRLLMNDRHVNHHTVVLRDLKPSTTYGYTAGSPDLGNWSEEATFRTGPGTESPFSFITFGDTHRSPEWGRMLQAAYRRHPDAAFYAIAGDVVSMGLFRDEWDSFFAISNSVFSHRPIAFALGNHDDQDGLGARLPLALFEFPRNGPPGVEPERTYSFRYGNALFLVMDVGTPYEAQAAWMEQQLAATDAAWRFAIYHFPLYCLKDDDDYGAIRSRWEKVFARHHVDMVLSGHVHYYLRTRPMRNGQPVASPADGTIHLVSVGIPGQRWPRPLPPFADKYMSGGPWYQKFDIAGRRLVCRTYDANGKVHDELAIEKQGSR
jgi:acid phosphatase type 7